jgi:hypothetical protein
MTKFLGIFCFLLLTVCVVEYFYFQQKLMTWKASTEEWRQAAYDAEQSVNPLKIQLQNCESRPDTTQLTKELVECRNRCPQNKVEIEEVPLLEEKYATWPEFLHPDSSGHIPIIQQYLRSTVTDLNALKIMEYGDITRDAKLYVLPVKVRARTNEGKYRINTITFSFLNGQIYDIEETPGEEY